MPAAPTSSRHPEVAHALGRVRARLRAAELAVRESTTGRGERSIVVACSGGADSVVLLGLLCLLRASESLQISVAHVDHGLRPDSAKEAQLVTSLAAQRGVAIQHHRLALAPGPGLAARARVLRQAALIRSAWAVRAGLVALGHTQTDQAETVLLHLTRGAGSRGLSGMSTLSPWPPCEDPAGPAGHWVRPLLDLSRAQTRAVAAYLGLRFVDDPTNDSRIAPRTRIRHEVLPQLAQINPAVERAICTAAEHARLCDEALAQWATSELARRQAPVPAEATDTSVAYNTSGVDALPQQVRWRLIRKACCDAGLASDAVSAKTVAAIDAAWMRPGGHRGWDLRPGARVHLTREHLWVARPRRVGGANH